MTDKNKTPKANISEDMKIIENSTSLFDDIVNAGIPYDNHYSDLYIPVTPKTTALLKKHGVFATTFTNQVEGGLWYDCFAAYIPYWAKKLNR